MCGKTEDVSKAVDMLTTMAKQKMLKLYSLKGAAILSFYVKSVCFNSFLVFFLSLK